MRIYFTFLIILISFVSFSQNEKTGFATVTGNIIDNVTNQPVVGAKIIISSKYKSYTDFDGNYIIDNVPYGDYNIVVTMLSFDTIKATLVVDDKRVIYDILMGGSQEIEEMEVIGNIAQDRKTPVAVSTIGRKVLTEELGSQDIPMILNSTPGVHATQTGGGDGDARITIRGFSQRNVGVMIDGVPVNDMENGWVYWSNWFGLDAITSQIQVQRGLGATKLAMPSVGGTMNILTMNTGGKRKIKVSQEYGTGDFIRTSLSYKSGTLKNGWGILFSGSYKQGNGWVDGLNTQGGFYYLKIQKKIGNHVLSLSGFGAPQQHGQRSYRQGISYWDAEYGRNMFEGSDDLYNTISVFRNGSKKQFWYNDTVLYNQSLANQGLDQNSVNEFMTNYVDTSNAENRGIRYNEHWGYRTIDGKEVAFAERRNYYHKPQITLKDFWKINKKLSWSNILYSSIGRGGGQRYFNSASSIIYDEDGLVDWDNIIYNNQWKTLFGQTYTTADIAYHPTQLKSSQILSASVNNHFWIGGLSQFDYNLSDKWKIAGGIDYRYYKGTHYNEILDLLGGDYFVNTQDQNAPTSMKVVGDKIGRQPWHNYRDGLVQWIGGFAQAEYSYGRLSAFANLSTVANFYKGIDYHRGRQLVLSDTILEIGYNDTINYSGEIYHRNSAGLRDHQTDWVNRVGFTIKSGANFNVTEKQNIFLNIGYLSRTPQFSNVIDNTDNRVFDTLVNENITAFELGYGFRSKILSVNVNSYFTRWENRPLPYGLTIEDPNDPLESIVINVPGMDALHMGAEIDLAYRITKSLTFEAMASYGDWTWNSAETVQPFNNQQFGYDMTTITFDATGVHVGDAAQSTYAASLRFSFFKTGYIKLKYTYFDRYFSDFDPASLSGITARIDSWEIPSYGLMSIHTGYRLIFNNSSLIFRGNIFNALNTIYISDASNNRNFDETQDNFNAQSASVFFGQGIRFNISLGFEF